MKFKSAKKTRISEYEQITHNMKSICHFKSQQNCGLSLKLRHLFFEKCILFSKNIYKIVHYSTSIY